LPINFFIFQHKQTNEDKRKNHQRELADALNEAAKARLADLPGAENVQRVKKSNVSYKAQEKFPNDSEVNECKIFVGENFWWNSLTIILF
jgi:hypothetical protein